MTWQPERPAFGAYEHAMPQGDEKAQAPDMRLLRTCFN